MNSFASPRKIQFGDLLLLLYALTFVREYAWVVPQDWAAWIVSVGLVLALWAIYLRYKPADDFKVPRMFWFTVALPLFIIYGLRAAIPDLSFDVLNHRLIQGERALRGSQFLPDDFFPNVFPFNPSSDMLTGMFRHVLGYRLGTILNPLALVWTGIILERILRPVMGRTWQRCVGIFLILFTEHIMFEISTYMVDLLALPLILEATRLALGFDESKNRSWDLCFSALLLSLAMGLKLTNAPMIIPVMLVFAIKVIAARPRKLILRDVAVAAVLFLLPLLPHIFYIYGQTRNPFFPLYNDLFHSPYWPDVRMGDGRWGAQNLRQLLAWPLITFWMPQRLSELGVYAGRLTLGVVAAFVCILLPRVSTRAKFLSMICILGAWMWGFTSGYARYVLFIEVIGGLLLLSLFSYLCSLRALPRGLRIGFASMPIGLLLAQCVLSAAYVAKSEWSLRPISFQASVAELRWVGRDRSLLSFQSAENRQVFGSVDAWIVSGVKTNGIESLLRPSVPILGINYNEYFNKPASRERFRRALDSVRGQRVYSLVLDEDLDSALKFFKQRGLEVGSIRPIVVPFYSLRTQFALRLIEVLVAERNGVSRPANQPEVTEISAPLNDDAFVANISGVTFPSKMKPGQVATISVQVTNASNFPWRSRSNNPPAYAINVADIWLHSDAQTMVTNMDARQALPRDLWPGDSATVQISVKAPTVPGDYLLEIDLVQEGVAFFKEKGSHTWRTAIKVE